MEELVRGRRPVRFMFETLEKELRELLGTVPVDIEKIEIKLEHFIDCCGSLEQHDALIKSWMIQNDSTPEIENQEYADLLKLKERASVIRKGVEKLGVRDPREPSISTLAATSSSNGCGGENRARNFKLPAVQIPKFKGDLKEWLRFWDQFKKIDEDDQLDASDKFFYLIQCLIPGTDAHDLVSVYPQNSENYPKALEALKERYGNADLLLQVYVRELLTLVIANASSKEKIPMKKLYTQLDSHLKALETLNLQRADPSTWIYPLVESSLPDTVLLNWKQKVAEANDEGGGTRLSRLMKFMKTQVEIGQEMEMTKSFTAGATKASTTENVTSGTRKIITSTRRSQTPVVSVFHSADMEKCIFCQRTNHEPQNCFAAKKMSAEEKQTILKENRRCFKCCGKHFAFKCNLTGVKCQLCGGSHYSVLCLGKRRIETATEPPAKKSHFLTGKQTTTMCNQNCSGSVALQTVMAEIIQEGQRRLVRVFLDGGSQRSYILKKTVDEMKLKETGKESVIHSLFGGVQSQPITHRKFDVTLQRLFSDFKVQIEVRDNGRICASIPNDVESCDTLRDELTRRNIFMVESGVGAPPIDILIGADYYGHFLTGNKVDLDCGMVAIETILGWTVMGKMKNSNKEENSVSTYMNMTIADASVTQLWDLESLGIRDPAEVKSAEETERAIKDDFFSNLKRNENGRYVVKLPWRDGHPPLPNYKSVCRARMQKSYEKLLNVGLVKEYGDIFQAWKAEHFIEDDFDNSQPGHYVPHRPVIKKDSKTTPIRPVFNASFKTGTSPSLNECLHKGSNYIQKIPEILLKFRERNIGFVSDIRKAFQMIEVDKSDRDATRFLWKDVYGNEIEFRHARVMFGATCSPFILGAVLEHFLNGVEDGRKETAQKLLQSFYVDNSVSSVNSKMEYEDFKGTSIGLLQEIQMDLREWYSSAEIKKDEETITTVLGMCWDRSRDELFLKVGDLEQPEVVTKKVVLSIVQKIFDVIGIASPAILPMKLLLQRAWINKLGWDAPLPEEKEKCFSLWLEDINVLQNIRIPRQFTGGNQSREDWSLHIFCDASQLAYGTIVFLRTTGENGLSVQMLDSKCKVAPMHRMTIPRLELLGCFLGARLSSRIRSSLEIEEKVPLFYWSDSSTALSWIKRNEEWGTFVYNRAKEIRKLTDEMKWKHVPGIMNPADLISRGCTAKDLMESRFWEGPDWLRKEESEWPESAPVYEEEKIILERKKKSLPVTITFILMDSLRREFSYASQIRILAWIGRFYYNCKTKSTAERRNGELSQQELKEAELFLIKFIQMEYFPEDDRKMLKGLDVIEDEFGILRVKTRLVYREDEHDFKFPAILPGKDEVIRKLIMDTHKSYCHAGAGFLVSKLREKYWILKARRSVVGVISKCVRCRKLNAKPVIPQSAPLPLERVKNSAIFQTVGVDLFGPVTLKPGKKIWVTIFTCAVYRAVHFEIVTTISSTSFVAALKKFISRYRRPEVIHCDNGTNFRGADKLFKKLDWSEIIKYEDIKPIFFKFSPPNSSWWGGYWERLIRSAKDLIKRTIGNGSCSRKEFEYLLEAVAGVMNGRPLTYISESPNDLETLTPNHFLHPWGNVSFPEAELTEAEKFRFRYQYVQKVQEELKMRFRKEYLSMLVSRNHKKASGSVKVGDIVYVGSDNKKRTAWPLGRILNLLTGQDGVDRVAEVKTEGGVFLRSLQNLYPLELDESSTEKEKDDEVTVTRSGRAVCLPQRYGAH